MLRDFYRKKVQLIVNGDSLYENELIKLEPLTVYRLTTSISCDNLRPSLTVSVPVLFGTGLISRL